MANDALALGVGDIIRELGFDVNVFRALTVSEREAISNFAVSSGWTWGGARPSIPEHIYAMIYGAAERARYPVGGTPIPGNGNGYHTGDPASEEWTGGGVEAASVVGLIPAIAGGLGLSLPGWLLGLLGIGGAALALSGGNGGNGRWQRLIGYHGPDGDTCRW